MISHTLNAWATALGKEPRTLERQLVRVGVKLPEKGGLIPASDVFLAADGDAEKKRLTAAQAEAQERENALARGDLQTLAGVLEALWENGLSKVREDIISLPKQFVPKLRAYLEAEGLALEKSKRAGEMVSEAVHEPLAKLNALLPKGATGGKQSTG